MLKLIDMGFIASLVGITLQCFNESIKYDVIGIFSWFILLICFFVRAASTNFEKEGLN